MLKMGFKAEWIDLVMKCMETATFSFVTNREPCGFEQPSGELQQGNLIWPYLFLFCAEALSNLLTHTVATGQILGHKVCALVPSASHLLLADDTLIFCKPNRD